MVALYWTSSRLYCEFWITHITIYISDWLYGRLWYLQDVNCGDTMVSLQVSISAVCVGTCWLVLSDYFQYFSQSELCQTYILCYFHLQFFGICYMYNESALVQVKLICHFPYILYICSLCMFFWFNIISLGSLIVWILCCGWCPSPFL